jgi:hypothetical protein
MLNIHHDESQPSRVTVAFEHGALSFMMSKDSTLEDLEIAWIVSVSGATANGCNRGQARRCV